MQRPCCDFHGLPDDFPGLSGLPSLPGSALDAVRHGRGGIVDDDERLARFITVYRAPRIEVWYFANPVKVAEFFEVRPAVAETMEQTSREACGPGKHQSGQGYLPSKRLSVMAWVSKNEARSPCCKRLALTQYAGPAHISTTG
ncbi:MAG: hypothetical protein U5O69_02775 [Candidatus Competibacteraceae bacterium]|nr:hypothetical protein [Candidatus Competibacteraceae bacterium]